MLNAIKLPSTFGKSTKLEDQYLNKVYCPMCDTKRSGPCECRSSKFKSNILNLKGTSK